MSHELAAADGAEGEDAQLGAREDLRAMWELPSVVHFAQVFRMQFKLRKFGPEVRAPVLSFSSHGSLCSARVRSRAD